MLKTITVAVIGLSTLALGVQPADAATKQTLHYYEKATGFTYIPAGGKPTHKPPSGPPKPGDRIEVTGNLYKGDHKHHATKASGTDHTICLFDSRLQTYCDAQAAFGGSMLLVFSTGGVGDFTSTITGGTGRFTKTKGTVHTHPIGDTGNSDLTLHLR
ncbi:MAG: hypothetical protein JWN00_1569 [Actinomycetia bacterium]|nr:hypothetical protein [Actinomycetes bacterium]